MAKAIECYEHNETHWTFHKQGDPLTPEDFEEISEFIDSDTTLISPRIRLY